MSIDPANAKTKMLWVVLLALAMPVVLVAGAAWMMFRGEKQPTPDPARAAAMQSAIERAAETVMPAPSLGSDVLSVACPPEKMEAEVQRVVRLARGVGGSASSWNNGEVVRIIAKIPSGAATLYQEAVTRGYYDAAAAGDGSAKTIVEVVIRPVAAAPAQPAKTKKSKR